MATSSRKTTDLERLTQPGGKVMPDDATIPVLTERLTLPSLDLDISLPKPPPPVVTPLVGTPPAAMPPTAAPVAEPAPAVTAPPVATPAPPPPPLPRPAPPPSSLFATVAPVFAPSLPPPPSPEEAAEPAIDWDRVETELRESVLRELQPLLTAELERQVRDRLQPTLVRALTALISDLRPALDSTVRETISRAVADEIERQRRA
ncbi:MAG: hypothetical protein ACRECQ_15760 [Burkholderiaceae bacterium]